MIHVYVHGRGRGHATRSLAIAAELVSRGHAVRAFAGATAAPLLEREVPTTRVASLPPKVDLRSTALLGQRVAAAVLEIRRDRPECCVVDGDLPGLLAARFTATPSIAVGHGLIFSHCRRPRFVQRLPWLRQAARNHASNPSATHFVPATFVPLRARASATTVARSQLGQDLRPRSGGDRIVCYFRDSAPQVVERIVALGESPAIFGPAAGRVAGAEYHAPDRTRFVEHLLRARAVVCSAGSQLLSECVSLQLPVLALHHRDDDEQRINAAMVRSFGLGDGCAFAALGDVRLRRFIHDPPEPQPLDFSAPDVTAAVAELVGGALKR